MFKRPEAERVLLRLYAKSEKLGYVPGFDEMNRLENMPMANTYAMYFKSYEIAAGITKRLLKARDVQPLRAEKLTKKQKEDLRKQDEFMAKGWIPIQPRPYRSMKELLAEVTKQADENGILPDDFLVNYDLSQKLEYYIETSMKNYDA